MIRPLTIATCIMACGSGLYLYQSKHEVQLLDRTIERTVRDTNTLREQSRLLATEWTVLNDPERLRQFSDTYLNLKSTNPAQFTSLADLDGRLPAVRIEPPPAEPVPVAEAAPPQPVADASTDDDQRAPLPVPPVPAVRPAAVAAVPIVAVPVAEAKPRPATDAASHVMARAGRPAEAKPATAHIAEAPRPAEQRSLVPHIADARPAPQPRPVAVAINRPVPQAVVTPLRPLPAPVPQRPAVMAASAPPPVSSQFGGSLLGMARGAMSPAPRPTPVNATYSN